MKLLYTLYFKMPNFGNFGLFGKIVNRIMSIGLKLIFDSFMPAYLDRSGSEAGYGLSTEGRKEKYIVSLTSFPARIDDIWISIEILLRQTFKPDAIILWLSEKQFPERKLPKRLRSLRDRGLTVEFCTNDLRAHKKYFYAMKRHPEANIITFDDDLYYDYSVIQNLVNLHQKFPNSIVTNRAHKLTFKNGQLNPYRNWMHNVINNKPSHLLMATGGAGTLYPPGSLNKKVFDEKLIKELCFYADDIWLKIMAYLNDTKIVTNGRYNKDFVTVSSTQGTKLVSTNVINGGNDRQLENVCNYFDVDFNQFANHD